MAKFKTEDILNFALVGHGTVGKTMLSEAMLFNGGSINRMGSIDNGNTVSDYHNDEIERQISINTSILNTVFQNKKFNILDTPGYADFYGEVQGALRVADFALVIINGFSNVEVGTEQVWESADEYNVPHMVAVNMLDKENADFDSVLAIARERFGSKVFPFGLPISSGPNFHQIVDVLRNEIHTYKTDGSGKYTAEPVSGEWAEKCKTLHQELIELVAESDDTLLEKFFDQDELSEDELRSGLHGAFLSGSLIPVFPVAAIANIGVVRLMDVLAKYAPCASDFKEVVGVAGDADDPVTFEIAENSPVSAFVFKTVSEAHLGELSFLKVYSGKIAVGADLINSTQQRKERMGTLYYMSGKNRTEAGEIIAGDIAAVVKLKNTHTGDTLCVHGKEIRLAGLNLPEPKIRAALMPKSKGDEEKISAGLSTIHEEDPTFVFEFDPELKQTVISGQGELHLQTVVSRLKQRFSAEVELGTPRVAYRETITGRGESKYRHKKQSGGAGQFAEVWMYVEPLAPGSGVVFESELKGQSIDRVFIPSIEKGVMAAVEAGVYAGYRCVDVKAVVYDGKQHPVDSKDIAFQMAGKAAFKEAFLGAKPKLLEPIYEIGVKVPEEFMGDVMGDVSSRRGRVLGMETEGRLQKVIAQVPLGNLDNYATTLRSMTGGRGMHTQKFHSYEQMPPEDAKRVVAEAKADSES